MHTGRKIIGVGIDMVEIADIKKARFKDRFAEYFLIPKEIREVPLGSKKDQYLASRFALKEAVIKAFPETLSPFDFVVSKKGRRPSITFVHAERNREYSVFVSLTHSKLIAAAVAVVVHTS